MRWRQGHGLERGGGSGAQEREALAAEGGRRGSWRTDQRHKTGMQEEMEECLEDVEEYLTAAAVDVAAVAWVFREAWDHQRTQVAGPGYGGSGKGRQGHVGKAPGGGADRPRERRSGNGGAILGVVDAIGVVFCQHGRGREEGTLHQV